MSVNVVLLGKFDEAVGFALAGVKTHAVHDLTEASMLLHQYMSADGIELVLLAEEIADLLRDDLARYDDVLRPIILEVPGRMGETREDPIKDIIKKAIGVDVER